MFLVLFEAFVIYSLKVFDISNIISMLIKFSVGLLFKLSLFVFLFQSKNYLAYYYKEKLRLFWL